MKTTALLAILFSATNGQSQGFAYREPTVEGRPVLRVDTNLVLVPVTVTDSRGAVVQNLGRSDFTLTEEKARQDIVSFSHETAPVSLGILVDLSGSMKGCTPELWGEVTRLEPTEQPDVPKNPQSVR